VKARDCPAAVSGNERRHEHWAPAREATVSRTVPAVIRLPGTGARESEDLPVTHA